MSETDTQPLPNVLDEKTVDRNPIDLFRRWFDAAVESGSRLPESMTLATATRDGQPSARVVLLKGFNNDGFVFYTNYNSSKGRQLEENPYAALVMYWTVLDRQVRVEGSVKRVSTDQSDEYFRSRPRESQIGALASPQSEVIESRQVLEQRFKDFDKFYRDRHVERPAHWGGYILKPQRIEFWQNRSGRLHDRVLYELESAGSWSIKRLAP
ncbi:MAG TPA: pyridoxamine 5'-phosphate oxidase [Pyrinomonadaceae bacterium]|nr:pyridoxamine 5'-phosphate oxidase [Pyrinomonadaceae bacterium]